MARNESELGRVQLVAVIPCKVVGCSRSFGHLRHLLLAFLSLSAPYSKPNLNLEPNKDLKPGDLAAVTCHASRGYPEASVLWQDSQGTNITENITTSQVANEEGLFDVHSVLQVLVEPSSTYSCLVRNPVLQQETHASVTITGEAAWTKFVKGRVGSLLKKVAVVAQSYPRGLYTISWLYLSAHGPAGWPEAVLSCPVAPCQHPSLVLEELDELPYRFCKICG